MKAARKTAANVVVASWWEIATAAFDGVAPVLPVAGEPEVAEAVAIAVAEVDDESEESPELPSTAVALRVPHCWFLLQVSCPCASLGFAAIHCT